MILQQILEARALATPITYNFTADDTFPAIVIQYVPALGTGGTSASFTLANNSIAFLVDSSAATGKDAIGDTGVIDVSAGTYDTMGELVDYINGRAAWRAYLVGSLRADTAVGLKSKSTTKCSNDNGVTLYIETVDYDATVGHSFAISGEKFINNGVHGHVKDADDACENSLMYGYFLISSDSDANYLRYLSGAAGKAETVLMTEKLNTDLSTAITHGEENFTQPFIKAKRGERLIVRLYTGSTIIGTPTVNVIGQVAVLKNHRIADSDNFGDA